MTASTHPAPDAWVPAPAAPTTNTASGAVAHAWEPTDTEGHAMECLGCGQAWSFYDVSPEASALLDGPCATARSAATP